MHSIAKKVVFQVLRHLFLLLPDFSDIIAERQGDVVDSCGDIIPKSP
jgi:hypothetical protein